LHHSDHRGELTHHLVAGDLRTSGRRSERKGDYECQRTSELETVSCHFLRFDE
jgi:hypothetical protein